jgi:pilus assembly protein CpaE
VLVVDRTPELAARIRHNAAGPRAVVKACPDTARAGRHLAAGHWDVVVAGPSLMHQTGLRRLASLHQRHPWVSIVLALHERPRADLAEIVQVGACDLVPLHADHADLRETLARAARLTRARLGVAAGPGGGRGRVVMVASASGGCGKTFVATTAAPCLARATGGPVVLVDLDLQFGEVSTALRLRPELTITDALAAEAAGADLSEILDEYLLSHPDGFKVLAAPTRPAEADSVTPGDVTRLLDVLRARRAWVVVDTHEGFSDVSAAALEATDHVFAVATPDRPSLLNLERFLAALERLGMAAGAISVVLNKAEPGNGFDRDDMAAHLGRPFDAVVPYSRHALRSTNVGVPLLAGQPKSPIARLLATALSVVLPGTPPSEPGPVRTPAAPSPIPIPIPVSVPVAAPVPVPTPTADPAPQPPPPVVDAAADDSLPGDDSLPDDEPVDIDLSSPRPCRAAVPARHTGRCRRSPRLPGAPLGRCRAPPLADFTPLVRGTSPPSPGK